MTIICLGRPQPGGTYLLRIRVREAAVVQFGRFQNGRPILIPPADYLYIGSALGRRGSASLDRRLLRHASRNDQQPAHPIRAQLLDLFGVSPPTGKTLRWHVDYLLDEPAAELVQIIIIHSTVRLEKTIGQWLLADGETAVVAPGLGATDVRGNSHILRVPAEDGWWRSLAAHIQARFLHS